MSKKKLVLILVPVILLVGAGGSYEMVLKPKPKVVVPKVDGELVALADPFTVNLAGGHYGRVSVSLLVEPLPTATVTVAGSSGSTSIVPAESDVVRAVVTNDLTGIDMSRLIERGARQALIAQILTDLKKSTDVPV